MAVLAVALCGGLFTVQAQTNSNPGFISAAEGYLTSFNTNYVWAGSSFEFGTGYRQVTGIGAQNIVDGQKDFSLGGQPFNVGANIQFSGVGSAVNGAEAQFGWAVIQHYDTEVDADIRGGFGYNPAGVKSGVVEPTLMLKKLQTLNTATELGVSLPIYFHGKVSDTPTFYVEEVIRF